MVGKIIIFFVISGFLLCHILSGEAQTTKKPTVKKCMGANSKPTKARLNADLECSKKFPTAKGCTRLCRLETLGVIVNNQLNAKAWRSFVEHSFPTIAMEYLSPLLEACSPKFKPGTSSTSSKDCSENNEFTKCVRASVEKVCSMPPPH